MNYRAALHAIVAACFAISTGAVVLAGFSEVVTQNVAAICGLIGLVLSTYLGSTTTGVSVAADRPRPPRRVATAGPTVRQDLLHP